MSIINEKFDSIKEYLLSIKNNVEEERFEFEIGLPEKWYIKSNNLIECEIVKKIEDFGSILKIYSKSESATTEDVFNFIIKTIETNNKIADMEKSFKEEVETKKQKIKNEVEAFYAKIEELREKSFENLDDEETIIKNLSEISKLTQEAKKRELELASTNSEEKDNVESDKNKEDDINKETESI